MWNWNPVDMKIKFLIRGTLVVTAAGVGYSLWYWKKLAHQNAEIAARTLKAKEEELQIAQSLAAAKELEKPVEKELFNDTKLKRRVYPWS